MTDWHPQASGAWWWSAYSLSKAVGGHCVQQSRVTEGLSVVSLCCLLSVHVFLPCFFSCDVYFDFLSSPQASHTP